MTGPTDNPVSVTSEGKYVVVLRRTGFSTVYKIDTKQACEAYAAELNLVYQTDEYKVEPYKQEDKRTHREIIDSIRQMMERKEER